jgi:hypothetical protein
MKTQIKNIPKRIYLNIGDDFGFKKEVDFKEDFSEITWCEDKIDKDDIEYILKSKKKLTPVIKTKEYLKGYCQGLKKGYKDGLAVDKSEL